MTRRLWPLKGGIHPPENKTQSLSRSIGSLPIPSLLILPLQERVGFEHTPVVGEGDHVLKGQVIGEPRHPLGVPLHAPTSGTVTKIADHLIPHPSGLADRCIFLKPDGQDTWTPHEGHEDYTRLSTQTLINIIRQAGIIGLGGAGFPSHVKLHPPREDKVESLILNGAECEPYITADHALMRERAAEVIGGMQIMAKMLEPTECLIGVEDNKPDAITALRQAAANTHIEVVEIPTRYPSGGEKQLISILTGKEVTAGHIPADIGVMCQNVGTSAAVYRAVVFGEPLISRITTVTGEAVKEPRNMEVLTGTPLSELLYACGLDEPRVHQVIMGGPMMGFTLPTLSVPLVKTTNCIIAATETEMPPKPAAEPCIRCGMCAQVCPVNLLPQQLYWYAKAREFDKAANHNLADCIECGACAYVCPSNISLVDYYRHAKAELRQTRQEKQHADRARERFEFRKERLEREKAAREAKRQARAAATRSKRSETGAKARPDAASAIADAVERAKTKRQQPTSPPAEAPPAPATEPATPAQPGHTPAAHKLAEARRHLSHLEQSLRKLPSDASTQIEQLEQAVEQARIQVAAAEKNLRQSQESG